MRKNLKLLLESGFKSKSTTPANSGLLQLGFQANFKVGFVLGSWFLNRYIWLTKSPTDAKPRDVSCNSFKKLRLSKFI